MTIFPDSNIFIHFQPIEKWDWKTIQDQDLEIGLCMCIINELDKIKYSANSNTTKRRVQEIVKKFSKSSNYIFNDILFSIIVPEKLSDTLISANLDKEDKDDKKEKGHGKGGKHDNK